MFKIKQLFPVNNHLKNKKEFELHKFKQNNIRILILTMFLVFEQAVYGLLIDPSHSLISRIHLVSALLMAVFAAIAAYFQFTKVIKVKLRHKIFEVSLGLAGLIIAIIRVAFSNSEVFRLPTIYIAVLYGLAVIFHYNYLQSFILYAAATVTLIFTIPHFHPTIKSSSYIADAVSNGLIAWLVSTFNYHKFVGQFVRKKLIQHKNKQLVDKNKEIKEINERLEE
ncbi:MAG: hypothetical protein ACQERJ_06970, partial [Bacillota bacterium]